ncbi:ribosome maturation factor RimM [Argonema galeatum]|uniref:ribosome maturation factor RimM n=1 Tax=Argonema galeatum TaxID=2942762 RepID=UPI00201382E6|nr:ribosome maturation factor RimM [Argonema galeatum]MCL1464600.1 ribosome maturation factor RimM [Argonema galeatum A003/A1]
MTNDNWLEIGTIVSAQGLKGELRVYPDTDFPERFEEPGKRWLLRPGETEPKPIKLLEGRYIPNKGIYVVKLAGISDRTQAEELRGCKLMVPQSDRPTLEEDEFHVIDLIGLEVFNQLTGESIGVVVDVASAGNDLLIVNPQLSTSNEPGKKTKEKQILIPFVKAIVPVVDLENGRIEITPPPGLLEI